MRRSLPPLLLLLLAGLSTGFADEEEEPLPDMGGAWFGRVVKPSTRILALYEKEVRGTDPDRKPEPFEEFAAGITYSTVFPCPQPGLPDAQAIITARNYPRTHLLNLGPGDDEYEALPLENERWKQWQVIDGQGKAGLHLWHPGLTLLEDISGNLVNRKGKQLSEGFFCGVGALADFNGDGMLDLLEIERISTTKKDGGEIVTDCVSIGPLVSEKPRFAVIYCNHRSKSSDPRSWHFTIREQEGRPALVLVPAAAGAGKELVLPLKNGDFEVPKSALPEDIWIDQNPVGEDTWDAMSAFLKKRGYDGLGVGSDPPMELEAGRPKPNPNPEEKQPELEMPGPGERSPREAATAIAALLYDKFYAPFFEWQHSEAPVPVATEAWLEMETDKGWGSDEMHVWWLADGVAERWAAINPPHQGPGEKMPVEFTVTRLPAERLSRDIAVIHEFDRLRRVPTSPFAPGDSNSGGGGDDFTTYQVRAKTTLPAPVTSNFGRSMPEFWDKAGARYDPGVSSFLATVITQKLPEGEAAQTRKIRELAPQWLTPERISKVPPALARIAIQATGENDWPELKPLLEKLKESFGPLTPEEKRLADIEDEGRLNAKDETKDHDEQYRTTYRLAYERKKLLETLSGEPRHELRSAVEKALKGKAPAPGQ